MPGVNTLPIEFQIVFWMLFIFIGVLCALVVFWTKRYVEGQDERMKKTEARLSDATEKIETVTRSLGSVSIRVSEELVKFTREIVLGHETMRREITMIEKQTSIISERLAQQSKVSDKISNDLEKQSASIGKVVLLEQNQSKIVTAITHLSERLLKVSQKKTDGS